MQALKDAVYKSEKPDAFGFLDKLKGITNETYLPSERKMEQVLGKNMCTTLNVLQDAFPYPALPDFANLTESDESIALLKNWLAKNADCVKAYEIMNLLLDNWVNNYKAKEIDPKLLSAFEAKVCAAHNIELTKEYHVFHFYSDGSIDNTKGGDCYGMRSVFSTEPKVLGCPKLSFPERCNKYTYAVLTKAQAEQFRNELLALLQ